MNLCFGRTLGHP